MPELPEVETVVRSLRPVVIGEVVQEVWSSGASLRQPVDLSALRGLRGARIDAIDRVGKYLLFRFSYGQVMVSHLGMTGRYLVSSPACPVEEHTHLRFGLRSELELRYVDPRRFGLAVVRGPGALEEVERLGPDPLGSAFTQKRLHDAVRGSRRDLKALLLDQGVVAGLGNIYVAEALFHAGLRPTRAGARVSRPALARLHAAIVDVLVRAVERRGTTLNDGGYMDALGQSGDNQHHLMVYGRDAMPCRTCQTPVRRIVQSQRSSCCPSCQK